MANKEHKNDYKSSLEILKKPEDVEIFRFPDGGAYEARIYALFLTHLKQSCECSPNRRIFDSFLSEKHILCSMVCQTPEP